MQETRLWRRRCRGRFRDAFGEGCRGGPRGGYRPSLCGGFLGRGQFPHRGAPGLHHACLHMSLSQVPLASDAAKLPGRVWGRGRTNPSVFEGWSFVTIVRIALQRTPELGCLPRRAIGTEKRFSPTPSPVSSPAPIISAPYPSLPTESLHLGLTVSPGVSQCSMSTQFFGCISRITESGQGQTGQQPPQNLSFAPGAASEIPTLMHTRWIPDPCRWIPAGRSLQVDSCPDLTRCIPALPWRCCPVSHFPAQLPLKKKAQSSSDKCGSSKGETCCPGTFQRPSLRDHPVSAVSPLVGGTAVPSPLLPLSPRVRVTPVHPFIPSTPSTLSTLSILSTPSPLSGQRVFSEAHQASCSGISSLPWTST